MKNASVTSCSLVSFAVLRSTLHDFMLPGNLPGNFVIDNCLAKWVTYTFGLCGYVELYILGYCLFLFGWRNNIFGWWSNV